MDRETLLALAERVEKATGPDRELDRLIAPLVGIRVVEEGHPLGRCYYDENGHGVPLPLFTASLDAAMTLVPEGYEFAVGTGRKEHMTENGRKPWAWCATGSDLVDGLSLSATPALALTAACLRSLAATSKGSAS
ncbi:hypothetical protein [Novosphingobium sp. HII-3]|uniref:hypothetical protein n=1 Tax=Novosphingobium sp. HII-3 TaxID=2075565 RepID=UPI000CDA4B3C|nr:hypothetical protein [Novosphingobium sp. HII-3]